LVLLDKRTAGRLKPSSDLVKPEINVGDYVLITADYAGIPATEVLELKVFLKDAVPHLQAAVQAAELFQRRIESTKHLKRQQAHEAFTPLIQLTRAFGDDVFYHLRFTWDGIIFLDREDSVMVTESKGKGRYFSGVHVTQPVGELHELEHG
jgi:hypothetical protein